MSFQPGSPFNVYDYFLGRRIAEGRGDRTALLSDAGSWTYERVHERAGRMAGLLEKLGVGPGDRVLMALPDGPEYVATLFGILRRGAVAVMVNPHLDSDPVRYFYRYTEPRAALVDHEVFRVFAEAAEGADPSLELVEVGSRGFTERIDGIPSDAPVHPTAPDDPAIMLFSGGTTGHPKGVVQPHRSFANTTELYGKAVLRLTPDDVTLSVPKLYFGYATGSNLFFPFAAGAAAALFPERPTPEVLFEKIETFRPTILVNVPTMIAKMLAHPGAEERDLSSLRLATSAGEALAPELHRRWGEAFGVPLVDGLGTAEMWHIFLSNRPDDVRPGTLGTPVPGFDVRVRDEEGRDLPDGEVGWLWVRGGSRALGYWQRMEKTTEAFRGEWYVSGDMVVRDEGGAFTYCGRGDDMLKVSGKWLAPSEVEDCLLGHPAVREVAVVGVEEEGGLLKPAACVVPDAAAAVGPGSSLAEELQAYVRERLALYKYPRRVTFADELPRTHLGKVDRGRVREMLASE